MGVRWGWDGGGMEVVYRREEDGTRGEDAGLAQW